uniref:Uncharacterized protein n=1 Tax=Coccolithus braarudii TaxID=221442 RepID=A0A7S0LL26_9EUKA
MQLKCAVCGNQCHASLPMFVWSVGCAGPADIDDASMVRAMVGHLVPAYGSYLQEEGAYVVQQAQAAHLFFPHFTLVGGAVATHAPDMSASHKILNAPFSASHRLREGFVCDRVV